MRILLIEDDTTISAIITVILKQNNYTVDAVYDGKTALDYLQCGIYDGIILDLTLPEVDGMTILQTIRNEGNNVPVLILSANSEIDDKVRGLDSGANDYLTKPFDRKELLARLRVLLRIPALQNDSVIRIGNLSLDIPSCTISTTYGHYQLVGKEYQILLMFMQNFNKVISAEHILERIWDYDSDATLKSVWTYISYIRRKMEALNADVTISTKRNLGYVLENLK